MMGIMKLVIAIIYVIIVRIFLKLDKKMADNTLWNSMDKVSEDWKFYVLVGLFLIVNMLLL